MSREEGVAHVLGMFDRSSSRDPSLVAHFTDDVDEAIADARQRLEAMTDNLAYVDNIQHPMAGSLHFCALMLAIYLALKDRGADVHEFGRKMLELIAHFNRQRPPPALSDPDASLVEVSKQPAKPGEFEVEVFNGEGDSYSMNIKSCAVCGLFSQYEAMDLVPYMCASDDVVSDIAGQGLQRTGTIALGAHHCDFVFEKGGEGKGLAGQYPEKIRLVD